MEIDNILDDIDGLITRVHVKNFFCHENLEVTLNKSVNFIVGRNGSGKSAVLTALVVGLGGRAAATNRGNNLHSFIKKGANSASVEIKIKNSSAKAYKANVYGDFITIVRTINSSGGSSYKIKSSSGETISTKFEEVNAITLAHDIQVDNPICVLNQDEARNFHASDAKKKYSLFRRATNMDQTEANYNLALQNCERAIGIWQKKNEAFKELEKELRKWETCYEQLQTGDQVREKQRRLQDEYYWSEIAEFEKESNVLATEYDKQSARIEHLVNKLKNLEDGFSGNNDKITELKETLKKSEKNASLLEHKLQQLNKEASEVRIRWRKAEQTLGKRKELLRREQKKVHDLEREVANASDGDLAKQREQAQAEIVEAQRQQAEGRARQSTVRHETEQARGAAVRAQAARDNVLERQKQATSNIKKLNAQLRELEERGSSSLAVYGESMVRLVAAVNNATAKGMFSEAPRGPIGAYLKVKDKKWSSTLEHMLGGSIQTFCVNTAEDSRRLFELMSQVYPDGVRKPAVTCSKFIHKRHNVSKNKVRTTTYISALDSLDISDPIIANFLIDNIRVESILLVPDHEEAIHLTDNIENVPVNLMKILTLDGSEYYPAPDYRCYGGAARPSRFLTISTAERKIQLQRELSYTNKEVDKLKSELELHTQEVSQLQTMQQSLAKQLHSLLRVEQTVERRLAAANDTLGGLESGHIAVLTEELGVTRDKVESLKNEMETFKLEETQLRTNLEKMTSDERSEKSNLEKLSTSMAALNDEVVQAQMKLDRAISERQSCSQRVNEERAKLAKLNELLEAKKSLIEKKVQSAIELCPRIEKPRSKDFVVAELKKLQSKLNSMRSDGLDKSEVVVILLNVQQRHTKTKLLLDKLSALIKEIKKTSQKHLDYCRQVQKLILQRVQYCFQSILTLRGYSGSMDIDGVHGTLELVCNGREGGAKRVASSSSSLSGGERSYSTVAFIMALWECVELPFYFLDEFDVFMDNVNRKYVMELLVDHALKNQNRQFVFLTPQDASSVTSGPNIKIHRMADPRA